MKIGSFDQNPLLVPVGLPPFSFRCPGVYIKNAALGSFNSNPASFLTGSNDYNAVNKLGPLGNCPNGAGSAAGCYAGMTPFVIKFDISCAYEPDGLNNADEACVAQTTLANAAIYSYFGCQSDMTDITVSPTDPLFVPFHMNLDRMNLKWLENLGWGASSGGSKSFESLGFPAVNFTSWLSSFSQEDNPDIDPAGAWNLAAMNNGTLLEHTVNGNYPFKKGILGDETAHDYYTHEDVLLATYASLPYSYAESSQYTSGLSTSTRIVQAIDFAYSQTSDWTDEVAAIGEKAYGKVIGVYSTATGSYSSACSVSSKALANSRRSTTDAQPASQLYSQLQ